MHNLKLWQNITDAEIVKFLFFMYESQYNIIIYFILNMFMYIIIPNQ